MPGKKRKNLSKPAPDFVKKKRKVGKVKKSGEALTFKSKSVVVPSQLKVALGPTTHRKQNFQILQTQLNHHNSTVRCEALLGLREILISHPDNIRSKLPRLVEQVFPCTVDLTPSVRQASYALLRFLTSHVTSDVIKPFFPAIVAQLCCGLTHIDENVQLDSVKLLDIYILQYSGLLLSHISKVVPLLISLLSRQTSDKKNAKPSKFQAASLQSVPSSSLLKLDSRLKILELISKLLLMALPSSDLSSSNEQCRKAEAYMVDLSRRAVFSMTDILSQNDKTSSSICHLSSNIPHIPILHSHGIVPDSSTTHDWPIISNMSLGVSSHFDGLLDVVDHLNNLVVESWMEVVPTHVVTNSSPNIRHVTFMNKLVEVLSILVKLLMAYGSSSKVLYHMKKEKLSKAYASIKAGISTYILKYFPFSVSRNSRKDQLLQLEHSSNFMVCNILGILRLIGGTMADDDERQVFVITAADFLSNFKMNHLASSSQVVYVISQISAEMIPLWCELSDMGLLNDQVAKMVFDFILRLYDFCHPQSCSKQQLTGCLCRVFMKEVAKGNNFSSSLVFEGLLQPWSSSLVNLLSDERGISPETFSVVVDAMAAAVQHGNTAIIEALPMKMECLFGSESYLHQASVATQRKALELLWYVPTLEATELNLLGKFATNYQLDVGVVQYLIQIIHHKFMLDFDPSSIMPHLPTYLHFMFTILLGWCRKELGSCTSSDGTQNSGLKRQEENTYTGNSFYKAATLAVVDDTHKACDSDTQTITHGSISEDATRIQQTIFEYITSGPLCASDVLHCLTATLHHKADLLETNGHEGILNGKEIEEEAKRLLRLVDQ